MNSSPASHKVVEPHQAMTYVAMAIGCIAAWALIATLWLAPWGFVIYVLLAVAEGMH